MRIIAICIAASSLLIGCGGRQYKTMLEELSNGHKDGVLSVNLLGKQFIIGASDFQKCMGDLNIIPKIKMSVQNYPSDEVMPVRVTVSGDCDIQFYFNPHKTLIQVSISGKYKDIKAAQFLMEHPGEGNFNKSAHIFYHRVKTLQDRYSVQYYFKCIGDNGFSKLDDSMLHITLSLYDNQTNAFYQNERLSLIQN